MSLSASLRFRAAFVVFALSCSLLNLSGCGGGWGDLKPTIVAQLTNGTQTVTAGQTATFQVTATGTGPFTYQWFVNGVPITGATSSTYSTTVKGSDNGSIYTAVVTNAGGSITSAPYTLTVNIPPTITTQPANETVAAGQAATFTAVASGTASLSYQWYQGGVAINGATSSSYTTPATMVANNGSAYTVTVTNAFGSATSSAATLTVTPLPPALSFAAIPAQTFGNPAFTVNASSPSSGAVTYSVVSGPATVSGSTVTLTGAGTVVLSASQAANGNYTAAAANTSFAVAPEVPALSFAAVPAQTFGNPAFTISASSASTGAVTYSVVSGPATVSGSTVTITGAGTVVLSATQAANGNYAAATVNTSIAVATEVPTLTFAAIPTQTFGNPAFPVSATSASNGAVTYSVASGPATISGSTVTPTGIGSVTLNASQAASGNYTAATASTTFAVVAEVPTLTFASIPAQTFGNPAFTVSASSASSGAVTYSVASGPATISGSTVTLNGAGPVVLSATQAANGNYTAATASTNFTVAPEVPTLTFASIPAQTFGNPAFTVNASSASAGAVTYSVVSGPATVSGSAVTITGAGTVVLKATQAASGNYAAATTSTSIGVAVETPTLSFAAIPAQTFGNPAFSVSASSASAGAVTYSVVSGPATISGSTVTLTGAGPVTLSASQAASGNYTTAAANTSFTIAPQVPTLSFASVPAKTFGNPAFTVSALSASSGAITYFVVSGPATIAGSTVTLTGAGPVSLSASQAANGNYAAATASVTFPVAAEVPTLTFATINPQTYGNPAFTVSANSASTGAVTYSVASGPATIAGSTLTITGAGPVTLNATQAASGNYTAATASTSFVVAPEVPTLSFTTIPAQTYGNPAFSVSATSASAGAVTYSVASGPATVSGSTVTITGPGTVNLSASQAASGNYAAGTASTSFVVNLNVTISPISPANLTIAPAQQSFNATAVGGQTDTLTWTATGGSFVGNTWTPPNTAGTYTITATSVDQPSVSVSTTITVSAPVIVTQPVSQNVCTNSSATLAVAANYAGTYQWNLGGVALPGATSSSYFIANAASMDAGLYSATVTNPAGSVTSNTAKIVVGSSISSNPASLSIFATQTATFSVSAAGISPFTYQWYRVPSGATAVPIAGATTSSYITPAVTTGNNSDQYYVIVTDACGTSLTSSSATLTVTNSNVPPTIITQPIGVTVPVDGTATFTATASGTPNLTYQWYRIPAGSVAGTAVSGATSASYTVPATASTASNDQDAYYLVVKNGYGQAVSQNAPLVVGNGVMIQITDQPSTVYVNSGAPATFSVAATSTLPLTYQWQKAAPGSSTFTAIPGATSPTYTLPSSATTDTGAVYHVVVSNGVTTAVTSSSASLFVGALANIASCSSNWTTLGDAISVSSCSFQLTAATTSQYGEIVWPTLISTGNIRLSYTIATSDPSPTPADGFAMVLGDPSLGATLTSQGQVGEGLGARGIPGFVLAFDDYENNASGGWPQDPGVPYLGVGRGENALWENPYFNTNTNIPALAQYGATLSHDYVVTIVQGQMTVTMDGTQVFSGHVSVPPVAYLYVTSSTGGSWERTIISNISATISAPSN